MKMAVLLRARAEPPPFPGPGPSVATMTLFSNCLLHTGSTTLYALSKQTCHMLIAVPSIYDMFAFLKKNGHMLTAHISLAMLISPKLKTI